MKNQPQFKQKCGWDNDEAAKLRITVELRQVILNFFKEGAEPVGALGDTLVIVAGTHCRLNNVSLEGAWIESEKFWVGNKLTKRVAGKKVGSIMQGWRDLRAKRPELFEGISVMQQPAVVVDSVITTWSIV